MLLRSVSLYAAMVRVKSSELEAVGRQLTVLEVMSTTLELTLNSTGSQCRKAHLFGVIKA